MGFAGRWVLGIAALFVAAGLSVDALANEGISFAREIRPILSENCFACHGPDEAERQGGFRLDAAESALGEADSGSTPIVPGDPAASEVLARVTSDDDDMRMPPPEFHKRLTFEQVDLIRRWIAGGAAWERHWSLVSPERPELPEVGDDQWPRGPIDRFILARLEAAGLAPSPPADRATLLRRVTFDLTGLPPTPEELHNFVNDNSSTAYESVVDRLLESPRYGEHMARYWLDAARYADTHGLHLDNYREMWPYRDWVVRAFNENKPFDEFTTEQLAGDLLPEPTDEQLIATGFNRCHVSTNEGGSIAEEVLVRNVVDRVDTFSTVFLGLTMGCTRCHDHKYDPLTMHDYYSMFAYFNSLDGDPMDGNRKDHAPVIRTPTDEQTTQLADLDARIAEIEQRQRGVWPELDEQQAVWESQLVASADGAGGLTDGSLLLSDWHWVGPFDDIVRYLKKRPHGPEGKPIDLTDEFERTTGDKIRWQRRTDWPDGKVHNGLPGDTAANFLYRTLTVDKPCNVKLSLGSDDGLLVFHNGREVLEDHSSRPAAADQHQLELELQQGENELLIKILNFGGPSGFYFQVASDHRVLPEEVVELARIPAHQRDDQQRQALRDHFRNNAIPNNSAESAEFDELTAELAALREKRNEVDAAIATTLIWRERETPRTAKMLDRGEYDQPGEEVARRTPAALPLMSDDWPNDRMGLAEWLVDPQHPLFARVTVNRFWQQVFGVGLVETAGDFGSQGTPPSHPELLDWLAREFIDGRGADDRGTDDAWNVKQLMKQLVMSAAYRQTSRVTPKLLRVDPRNRLLARGPRLRLDAEMLRDQALAVGGLLVDRIGGPSVKPPQPGGLWKAVGYSGSNTVEFTADQGPEKVHRRTLYTFMKRTAPPPQMNTFDSPSRESCIVRRERTNTPLQALLILNDPQYIEAARGLAQRVMQEAGSDPAARADFMFRLAVGREPRHEEVEELVESYRQEFAHYQEHPDAAKALTAIGAVPPSDELDVAELAAWTLTANVVLNLDEVISKN